MADALHLEALAHARRVLLGEIEDAELTVARRTHPPDDAAPVALLASFTRKRRVAVPLWPLARFDGVAASRARSCEPCARRRACFPCVGRRDLTEAAADATPGPGG